MQGLYCKIDEQTMNNFKVKYLGFDSSYKHFDKDWNAAKVIANKIINVKKDVFYHVPLQWIQDYNKLVWKELKFRIPNIYYDGRNSVMPNGKEREKISGQYMVNDLVNNTRSTNVTWYDFDSPKATTVLLNRGFNEKLNDDWLIIRADDVLKIMEPDFKDLGLEISAYVTVCKNNVYGPQAVYAALSQMPVGLEHALGGGHAIGNVICRDMSTGKIVPVPKNGVYVDNFEGRGDLYEQSAFSSFLQMLQSVKSARNVLVNQYKQNRK